MHTQTSRIYKGMDMNDVKRIHPHGHIPERFGEMNGRGAGSAFQADEIETATTGVFSAPRITTKGLHERGT